MKKIKILFTIPNFTTAGSGREMFNIIEGLDKSTFEPFICIKSGGGALYDEIISKGYRVIIKKFNTEDISNIIKKLFAARELARFFKQYHFDLWQSFNWSSDFTEALVAKWAGAKYLYVKKNMNWERKAWRVKSFLSHTIIARNTTLLRKHFASPYLSKKTILIPGGVDISQYNRGISVVREELNIPVDAYLISCVAQIVKVKGQHILLEAIVNLPEVYVVLAGAIKDEQYIEELRKIVRDFGMESRVIIPGPISNVYKLLNASNAFVLPTSMYGGHEEGCPVALLEAMACGIPCIASNVAGSNDLLVNDNGQLFTPDDPEALKKCIEEYITNKSFAENMGRNAQKTVQEKYTLDIEAYNFSKLYHKLTER
ncbi:MAG: glycosyltransferase [Taibaiella sp.]|nr:glycosyltransferase [Taibaiella sp.]